MDRVREWVAKRQQVLSALTGQALTELDFTDDRLALCLRKLSQSVVWQPSEDQLGGHLVWVYRLGSAPVVRLDVTTGTVYHDQIRIRFSRCQARNKICYPPDQNSDTGANTIISLSQEEAGKSLITHPILSPGLCGR